MKKMYLLFIGICFLAITNTVAQNKTIKGTVVDENSGSIPGVNVLVKGTLNGVSTDFDGNYTINTKEGAVLVFSYIGYKSVEVNVGSQSQINVTLQEDASQLDEIVIVGYGTQKRQAVTGSVAVADLDTYKSVPVNNVLETVKGTLPGLNVGGINTAGGVASLNIRGTNSISAGGSPLIVLDGVIYNGSLGDISPNDIDSFTVLKDASAAAVYGSRSANGVILIQTKSGKGIDGKPKFSVTTSYGVTRELEKLELYDSKGYLKRLLDVRQANGLDADPNLIETYLQDIELTNYNATPDHKPTLEDPYGLIRQNAFISNTSVSISNATEKTKYYISGSWTDQKGVIINDNFKNITGRINLSSDLTNWLNLSTRANYSFRDFSGISPRQDLATLLSPYASVFNEDGSYRQFPQTTTSLNSPFWTIPTSHKDIRNNLTGLVSAVVKFPFLEGLKYTVNFSNTMRWNESSNFYDENTLSGVSVGGRGNRSYSRTTEQLLDNIINYNKTFNDVHNIDITLLHSKEISEIEFQSASAFGFENTVLGDYKLEDGATQSVSTGGREFANIGQMARASYTYDKTYSLTGTFRRDGFSGFSKNKKYGNFSSLGFNWNISNEKFLENIKNINNLSLRVSYGSVGNQSIAPYQTLASVGTGKYVFGGDSSYSITQAITALAADNLSWETTTGWNYGVNFSLFNNRVSGSIDAYNTKTTDLIFREGLTAISGGFSILNNVGQIDNNGLELALHTENVQNKDFNWSSDFAFSRNRNSVASIKGKDSDGDGVEDDLINEGFFIGHPGDVFTYTDSITYNKNSVLWYHRNRDDKLLFDFSVNQQGLNSVKDELLNTQKNLTFGGYMIGKNMKPSKQGEGKYVDTPFKYWSITSKKPSKKHHIKMILHTAQTKSVADWKEQLHAVKSSFNDKKAWSKTKDWWHKFWNRSHIFINKESNDKTDKGWQVGRNYQLFRYQLACNSYGEYPTKFNGGLFTADPRFVKQLSEPYSGTPDYRSWGGGSHTAQNQRLVYWPMLKSGDFDMMPSQFDFYAKSLKNAELRTKVYWNHEGCSFTEHPETFALPAAGTWGFNSGVRKRSDTIAHGTLTNKWVRLHYTNQLEFSFMILKYYEYSKRDISKYVPFINSSLTFFFEHYKYLELQRTGKPFDENNKLVIYPSTAAETFKNVKNPTDIVVALKTVIEHLQNLPDDVISKEKKSFWKAQLVHIPEMSYSTKNGKKIIVAAKKLPKSINADLPEMYAVFPYAVYGIGHPNLDVAINTWKSGNLDSRKNYISWHQDAIFAARMGLTEEAKKVTIQKLQDSPRRFPSFWGPGHDYVPDHNWGGSGMIGLQDMLVQYKDDKIFLLPSWPKDWNVDFKIKAPENTSIKGEVKNGELKSVVVNPSIKSKNIINYWKK